MSAVPGRPNATNVQDSTSPASTANTCPPARTKIAPTSASSVPTATNSTTPQALTAHSSKHARPLASSKSCRKRESNDSAVAIEGPQHPNQHAITKTRTRPAWTQTAEEKVCSRRGREGAMRRRRSRAGDGGYGLLCRKHSELVPWSTPEAVCD